MARFSFWKLTGRSLAVRLIVYIVVFSSVITLAATGIQLFSAYRTDVNGIRQHIRQVEEISLPNIIENTWLLDSERLTIQLDGIIRLPDFVFAEVIDIDGHVLAFSGEDIGAKGVTESVPLTYHRRGREINIGTFHLSASLDGPWQRIKKRAGVTLMSNAIQTSLIAIFIYFLVYRLITRHMVHMARYAHGFSIEDENDALRLEREDSAGRGDELSDLVGAINEMREGLRTSYASLRYMNETLEKQVDERTQDLTREIAVRTKAEGSYRAALTFIQELQEASPIGVAAYDEEGQCISTNQAMADMIGATRDQVLAQNYRSVEKWKETGLLAAAETALETNHIQDINITAISSFGSKIFLRCHLVPLSSEGDARLMLMAEDVSDAVRAEKKMKASEQRFRDLAEAGSDWFWETDENLCFSELAGSGPETLRMDRSLILGKTRWDVISPDDMARDPEGWADHKATMEAHLPFRDFEYTSTGKDGVSRLISVSGKPVFDDDGAFLGYRGIAFDQTERRDMQVQLVQASKMATMGEMATGVAHELNQPLNVIRMATSNITRKLKKGGIDQNYLDDKLTKIDANISRAAAIIDHMRIFGRKEETARDDVNPCAAVHDVLGMVGEQLNINGVSMKLDMPETCPTVHANQVQLEQVLLNLITNARDALVVADTPVKTIWLGVGFDADDIKITVRDNAGGISDAILGRIFEPFFTTKETGKGTGLGLSISYGIIKDLGGTLVAENENGGAIFTLTLPLGKKKSPNTA